MEQDKKVQENDSLTDFIQALRIKHVLLFLLSLIFLGLLIRGTGNKERSHKMAIQHKKHHARS